LCELLDEIDGLIAAHSCCHALIAGDFNTDLQVNNNSSIAVNNFISNNKLYQCDILFPIASRNTSIQASSAIDYMLTSSADKVVAFNILELDINLSDHLPIMAVCVSNAESDLVHESSRSGDITHLRWDRAPIDLYYEHSRVLLQPVFDDLNRIIDSPSDRNSLIKKILTRFIKEL
jgi:hypothetical protein